MLGKVVFRHLSSLAEPLPRVTQGRYPVPNDSRFKQLMEKQTRFCRDDGLLVWQKAGADVTIYRFAVIGSAVATISSIYGLWRLISPPQNA
ncbi:unnamed protein product [Candidula unifasciata]|uniref:Uncharacterized protein n=1 Tax=Candidula unifasciata TaxID=100452 RepID=A0A8S3Z743_9EUPU|nr:unnamed protein product [Candidula unifasciata]